MNHESVWNIEPVTHDEKPNNPTDCDGGAMKVKGGGVIHGEGNRQEGQSVICRSGTTGDVSRERPAEVPEGFGVDTVALRIRGPGHATGEPVIVVPAPLHRGHSFCHQISRFCR